MGARRPPVGASVGLSYGGVVTSASIDLGDPAAPLVLTLGPYGVDATQSLGGSVIDLSSPPEPKAPQLLHARKRADALGGHTGTAQVEPSKHRQAG